MVGNHWKIVPLLFRIGDFSHAYGEDAKILSKLLGLLLQETCIYQLIPILHSQTTAWTVIYKNSQPGLESSHLQGSRITSGKTTHKELMLFRA
jgi:hypothetical protein